MYYNVIFPPKTQTLIMQMIYILHTESFIILYAVTLRKHTLFYIPVCDTSCILWNSRFKLKF